MANERQPETPDKPGSQPGESVSPAPMTPSAGPRVQLVTDYGETRVDCRRVVTLIGSREGCKVRLRHPRVSPVHAAIVNDGSHVLAIDLGSRTGTLLNGLKMEQERLNDGDVLSIGSWEFHVELEEPCDDTQSDVHPFTLDPSPHAMALEHIESGRILYPNRDVCTIGRRSACDIVLPDDRVSRVHALLLSYFGHPAICDLLSQNHSWVNDEVVSFQMINNDDVIALGDSRFRVRLVGSSVVERASNGNNGAAKPVVMIEEEHPPDEINIEETESSQRWRIADQAPKKKVSHG